MKIVGYSERGAMNALFYGIAQADDKKAGQLYNFLAKGKSDKKELDDKIAFYRSLRNECLRIAAHLRKRSKGVA